MGLDNYFRPSEQTEQEPTFPEGLKLCGGMFSGHGSDGSFRGKVYAEFFEQVLATDLYIEQSPEQIKATAEKLQTVLKEHPDQAWDNVWREDAPSDKLGYYGVTHSEIQDLAKLFEAAAEQSLKLVAWY